ncbi:hypothetical protein DDE82_009014 [Stemphylium lycopersici]|uniref:Uncharacterized protein n=1 Tax=Stemphylium lycopersici TaxID=183478 RepID=A0A364N0K1_STELY|nr:hypothetical protein TW65_04521 [Stemphylium lycopersici]RAQ98679.1 hypothetical protein DDE82_009014 [Stemphylium lycopersici]RAR08535.1 hypothetical protein DDE83_005942 [Stemphylium lycopersici]
MKTTESALLALVLSSSSSPALADLVIGKFSGEQLSGTISNPNPIAVTGTLISTSKLRHLQSIRHAQQDERKSGRKEDEKLINQTSQ